MSEAKEAKKAAETSEAPPLPEHPRRFIQYKPKGSRTIFINFVLPDGHSEILDTGVTVRTKANGIGRAHLAKICKARGIASTAAEIHASGGFTSRDRFRANVEARAQGLPVPFPIGNRGHANGLKSAPLARGPSPIARAAPAQEGNGEWRSFVQTYEQRCMKAFMRITELMLLGTMEDPQRFVEHIRALVLETMEGARKKVYMTKKRRAEAEAEDY